MKTLHLVLLPDLEVVLLHLVPHMVDLHMLQDLQVDLLEDLHTVDQVDLHMVYQEVLHLLELTLVTQQLVILLLLEAILDNIILDQDLSMEVMVHPLATHPMVHLLERLLTTMDLHQEHLDTTLVLPLLDLRPLMLHLVDLMVHLLDLQVDLHHQDQMDLQPHQTEPWDILHMEVLHLAVLLEVTVDLHLPVTFRNWRTRSIRWKRKECKEIRDMVILEICINP